MAEEQFTSRRARREAERLAAEQAFEARESPEQPSEPSSNGRAEFLNTQPDPADAAEPQTDPSEPGPRPEEPESAAPAPRADADERLDPQRAPLPHFDSRTARKNYLREHGLSRKGDVSTGAIPVVAGSEETADEDPVEPGVPETESFDTAGFGGSADEVAARDFEAPVTAESAPKPTALDEGPAPTDPSAPRAAAPAEARGQAADPAQAPAHSAGPTQSQTPAPERTADTAGQGDRETAAPQQPSAPEQAHSAVPDAEPFDEGSAASRSRRMPIVQPPSSSGVRVVTAASAQIPEVDSPESSTATGASDSPANRPEVATGREGERRAEHAAPAEGAPFPGSPATDSSTTEQAGPADSAATSSDDAARALAANPETRPMETVPEAWALPNPDYEDEETENPPGTRIRASAVTGHDGRILVGEEPSKVPYVVLGVAALFAVALIVIALVMLL